MVSLESCSFSINVNFISCLMQRTKHLARMSMSARIGAISVVCALC